MANSFFDLKFDQEASVWPGSSSDRLSGWNPDTLLIDTCFDPAVGPGLTSILLSGTRHPALSFF